MTDKERALLVENIRMREIIKRFAAIERPHFSLEERDALAEVRAFLKEPPPLFDAA